MKYLFQPVIEITKLDFGLSLYSIDLNIGDSILLEHCKNKSYQYKDFVNPNVTILSEVEVLNSNIYITKIKKIIIDNYDSMRSTIIFDDGSELELGTDHNGNKLTSIYKVQTSHRKL